MQEQYCVLCIHFQYPFIVAVHHRLYNQMSIRTRGMDQHYEWMRLA